MGWVVEISSVLTNLGNSFGHVCRLVQAVPTSCYELNARQLKIEYIRETILWFEHKIWYQGSLVIPSEDRMRNDPVIRCACQQVRILLKEGL